MYQDQIRNSIIIKGKKEGDLLATKQKKTKLTIRSTKNNRKNAAWLNNRNATKNAKVFNVTLYRDERGDFHSVGGESLVLNRKSDQWEKVNTRDLTRFINKSGIKSL